MKTIAPDYYEQFRCIAGQCRHTCCKGWEIDVDPFSLELYRHVPGELGAKLKENIVEDGCPHFRLTEDERCPFLNEQNLCELMLTLGEDALCQICADHPRFRNDFSDRKELGLGICCEAAAKLILGRMEKTVLQVLEDDGGAEMLTEDEAALLALREEAFALLQDRSLPVLRRIQTLLERFGTVVPRKTDDEWAVFFLSLERLDDNWTKLLLQLKAGSAEPLLPVPDLPLEQFAVYLLYRHLPAAQDGTEAKACLAFSALGTLLLRKLYLLQLSKDGTGDFFDLARMFSSEIEYSEENTGRILELLREENR